MSFIPQLFSNFGKSVNDLFKADKWSVDKNQLVVRTKTSNGVAVTSTNKVSDSVDSDVQVKYKNSAFGSAEVKATVNTSLSGKATFDKIFTGMFAGLVVKYEGEDGVKGVKNVVNAEYRQDSFALSAAADLNKKKADVSGVVGYEGLAVGASATFLPYADSPVSDYNGGFQYEQADSTVSVVTACKLEAVTASFNHILSKNVSVAVQGVYPFSDVKDEKGKKIEKSLTLGGKAVLDDLTLFKAKINSNGDLSAAFDYQARPFAKLSAFSLYNVKGADKPKFAVSLTLGETDE